MMILLVVIAAAEDDGDDPAAIASAHFLPCHGVIKCVLRRSKQYRSGSNWAYTPGQVFFLQFFFVVSGAFFFSGTERQKSCASLSPPTCKIPNTITRRRQKLPMASFVAVNLDVQCASAEGRGGPA